MSEDDKTHHPARGQPSGKQSSALQITPGAVLKDTYRIDAELGSGGMGTVFEATHLGLEKRMALKVLSPRAIASPESLARFGREARVAGKVNHPAMTHVIDFGVEQGTPYIVMEYVDGVELAEFIGRQGPMPPRQAVMVMRQIVSLLHAAHTLGIVHRDLKPANIKVVKAGPDEGQLFVKVLDFGIAKVIGDIAGQLTSEGMMVGTPAYMAPEQISGKPVDGRTDLYSAGLIFHEMLSGVRAYQGDTIVRILHAQLNEPPPSISLPLPDVLRQALQKFCEKRPEDRFQDAAQADRALLACEEALRSFSANAAPGPVTPQDGATRAPAVSPESLSATMRRPESAEVGGFSATVMRPEAGAGESKPPPGADSPARPVTDRQLAPEQFSSDGRPTPVRPETDRQPVLAPLVVDRPPAPVPPGPMPGPGSVPRPVPGAARSQPAKSSGWGKGCLIAVLVVGFTGCLGAGGLAALAWKSGLMENDEDTGSAMDFPTPQPPLGTVPAGGYQAPPGGAGCFVSDALFEANPEENGKLGSWEFVEFVSREPSACPSGRKRALSREAKELTQEWPVEEELLQVEVTPPLPDPENPGSFRKAVRVYTRASEEAP